MFDFFVFLGFLAHPTGEVEPAIFPFNTYAECMEFKAKMDIELSGLKLEGYDARTACINVAALDDLKGPSVEVIRRP